MKKILIVDDNWKWRQIMRELIEDSMKHPEKYKDQLIKVDPPKKKD